MTLAKRFILSGELAYGQKFLSIMLTEISSHNFQFYQGIRSCVFFKGLEFSFFQSYRGVRKGENLVPVLFTLVLNDLQIFLSENNNTGINLKMSDNDLSTYIKIFILLYADDTAIFGTDEVSFQNNLNIFVEYSKIWKLDINFDKTKILVFGSRTDFNFKLGENTIAICIEFTYLGIILTKNRSFFIKLGNIMLTRLERLYKFYTKEHVILIFPLICSCFYLITLFYLLLYTTVKSGDLKISR